jgi:hypothetical protein
VFGKHGVDTVVEHGLSNVASFVWTVALVSDAIDRLREAWV